MSSRLDILKKILYGDFDPSYYDEIIQKISDKLTDLGLIKQTSLLKGLEHLTKGGLQQLFDKLGISVNQIEPDRLKRYRNFERLYQKVPELYQAVGIYTDNIISPDFTTKKALLIMNNSEGLPLKLAIVKSTRTLLKQIIDQTKLEDLVEFIVKTVLIYGDAFVEIVDANQLSGRWKILQETHVDLKREEITESEKLSAEYQILQESESEDNASLARIQLKLHNPKHVVAFYIGDTLVGCLLVKGAGAHVKGGAQLSHQFQAKLMDYLMSHFSDLKKVVEENPGYKDDIANIIKSIEAEKVSMRFIPASHIVHFKTPSSVNYPYGESLFTPVEDIAKYVIASEIALLIYRLVRAPEKRIFRVNIGEDRTEVGEILEQVIRETKQKEYAVSQAGDIDALVSEITMFDDLYIPVYDGTPAFEVDTLPGSDLNTKIDDLNYLKDKMIAGLGIPPIYLRPQDQQADNKSTLAQENARFARTIIRYQKFFSETLTSLVRKIVEIVEPDKLPYVNEFIITFPPPVALMAEREAEVVNNVSQLIENLEKLGVPRQLIVSKYLPQFDWAEIEDESAVSAKIEDMINKSQSEEE